MALLFKMKKNKKINLVVVFKKKIFFYFSHHNRGVCAIETLLATWRKFTSTVFIPFIKPDADINELSLQDQKLFSDIANQNYGLVRNKGEFLKTEH